MKVVEESKELVKKINFKVNSAQNFCLLYITTMYGKRPQESIKDKVQAEVFNERFSQPDAEDIILQFMTEVMPEGGVLDVPQLNTILQKAIDFIQSDKSCKALFTKHYKNNCKSYVYSKYNDVCMPCEFADHISTVYNMTADFYGKDLIQEISSEEVEKFILSNFELAGNTAPLWYGARDIANNRWNYMCDTE